MVELEKVTYYVLTLTFEEKSEVVREIGDIIKRLGEQPKYLTKIHGLLVSR